MHMKDNLINFLYDKEYFINIYDNFIYVFNYLELIGLNNKKIVLKFNNFNIEIKGNDLFVVKMNKNELLIKGKIKSVVRIDE